MADYTINWTNTSILGQRKWGWSTRSRSGVPKPVADASSNGNQCPKGTAKLDPHFQNTTLIQCYAPNNEAPEEETTTFFDMLQPTIDKVLRSNMTIAFGGTNTKIGKDNHDREENMKKQVVELTKKMESSLRSFSFSTNWWLEVQFFHTKSTPRQHRSHQMVVHKTKLIISPFHADRGNHCRMNEWI